MIKFNNIFKTRFVNSSSPEALKLTGELFNELETLYGKGNIESFSEENKIFLSFVIIEDEEGKIAGCGALKHFDNSSAEIKRMYIKKEFRGMGLSKTILAELEEDARTKKYKRIVLETGLKQPAAIKLYNKAGYSKMLCNGKYADDPESVCFEKLL